MQCHVICYNLILPADLPICLPAYMSYLTIYQSESNLSRASLRIATTLLIDVLAQLFVLQCFALLVLIYEDAW